MTAATIPKPADWYLCGNRMLRRSRSVMQTIIAEALPVAGQSLRVARRRWRLVGCSHFFLQTSDPGRHHNGSSNGEGSQCVDL